MTCFVACRILKLCSRDDLQVNSFSLMCCNEVMMSLQAEDVAGISDSTSPSHKREEHFATYSLGSLCMQIIMKCFITSSSYFCSLTPQERCTAIMRSIHVAVSRIRRLKHVWVCSNVATSAGAISCSPYAPRIRKHVRNGTTQAYTWNRSILCICKWHPKCVKPYA